ncbi:hypothetical protein ANCCAN_06179 [Ancylostoma caninum]|uniref:Uncharacterized protein n=1 Tax=Ancylostoma caninum TaxID=29170 RepID=A0A368GXG2_ANCCA|nr:hypothetical protein ANCCAN_06179 [Ancylostoma caninum]
MGVHSARGGPRRRARRPPRIKGGRWCSFKDPSRPPTEPSQTASLLGTSLSRRSHLRTLRLVRFARTVRFSVLTC